ncbi:hypothetical protein KKA14_03955, partial [bacterium]|nr:hypothetical protein [bacterium]
MENRRDFIKNSAMAVMALSIPGCSSRYANGGSMIHDTGVNSMNERLRKIQGSPNYNGKKFVNPVNTNAGMVPGTAFDTMRQWIAGDEVRVPKFALPVKHPTPS